MNSLGVRQAITRFVKENAEVAQFLAEHDCNSGDNGPLRVAVFYADGALTRPTMRRRCSAELSAIGAAADFHGVHVVADVGAALVCPVSAQLGDLDAIRSWVLKPRSAPELATRRSLAPFPSNPIP